MGTNCAEGADLDNPAGSGSTTVKAQSWRTWFNSAFGRIREQSRVKQAAFSCADQVLAVGGGFLVNVALARTQTKQEYGMFALLYSLYTFITGIHNSVILEPYTVYGSGRYRGEFSEYLRLMRRWNALLCFAVSATLFLVYLSLWRWAPAWSSRALLGLAASVGILLSGLFLRRAFYIQRQASLAAKASLVAFVTIACGLWLTLKAHLLNGFSAFALLALGWIIAAATLRTGLVLGDRRRAFLELEPNYWREHWRYSKWVLATAFVFQLTTQGYYWLVAGPLSVREVGELRAIYVLVAPVEQALVAISFIVLPALAAHHAARRMDRFLSLWKLSALTVAIVTGLFTLGIRLVGKSAMHILYAGKFDGLAPLLYLLALLPVLMGVGGTMMNALSASEKPKFVFYGYLCSATATFALGIPLVTRWGLRGAVYGMLLSGATYVAAMTVGFLRIRVSNAAEADHPNVTSGSFLPLSGMVARLSSATENVSKLSRSADETER